MEENQISFGIIKLFLKDQSVETASPSELFLEGKSIENWSMEMHNAVNEVTPGVFEVDLTMTVKGVSSNGGTEQKVYFLTEVTQAGFFELKNTDKVQTEYFVNVECLNILFPYVRENIASAISKAGLSNFELAPISFASIWQQRMQEMAASQA